jgi:hypothetical protein
MVARTKRSVVLDSSNSRFKQEQTGKNRHSGKDAAILPSMDGNNGLPQSMKQTLM